MSTSKPRRFNTADVVRLAVRLKQVSDLTRLHVMLLLGEEEHSVGALSKATGHGMSALSRHLSLLRLAEVVDCRRDGQRNIYVLTASGRELHRVVIAVLS